MLKSPKTATELVKIQYEGAYHLCNTPSFSNIYPKKLCIKSVEIFREIRTELKYDFSFKTDFNYAESINLAVVKLDDQ